MTAGMAQKLMMLADCWVRDGWGPRRWRGTEDAVQMLLQREREGGREKERLLGPRDSPLLGPSSQLLSSPFTVFEAHSEAVSIFSSYSTSAFGVSMRTVERHVVPAAPSSLHFALELTVPLPPCPSKPSPVVFWVSLL